MRQCGQKQMIMRYVKEICAYVSELLQLNLLPAGVILDLISS